MPQRRKQVEADERPEAAADTLPVVVFTLDGQRFGLPLSAAERAVPMAAVSPLPGCPDTVLGAINVHGSVTPVLDLRRRLGLAASEYGPSAHLLLARTAKRVVALPVDGVHGVVEIEPGRVAPPDTVLPGIDQLAGIAALADGLLLVNDLELFLSLDEEGQLDAAIGRLDG